MLKTHHDPELGPTPVRDESPLWPWFLAGFLIVALSAGALFFGVLAHQDKKEQSHG